MSVARGQVPCRHRVRGRSHRRERALSRRWWNGAIGARPRDGQTQRARKAGGALLLVDLASGSWGGAPLHSRRGRVGGAWLRCHRLTRTGRLARALPSSCDWPRYASTSNRCRQAHMKQLPNLGDDYWGLRVLRGLDSAASFVHRHVPGGEDAHRQPVCTSGGSSSTSRSLRNACAQQNAMKALSCPHYKRCAPSSLLSALSKVARGR